ncbi:hypothetical protein JCM6882_003385 [Rhodosporidiobolus microsporus]
MAFALGGADLSDFATLSPAQRSLLRHTLNASNFGGLVALPTTDPTAPPPPTPANLLKELDRLDKEDQMASKNKKKATSAAPPPKKPAYDNDSDSDDMPPLEPRPADVKANKANTSPSKSKTKSGASFSPSGLDDDSDDDMPPLTEGPSKPAAMKEVKDVNFSKGKGESKLFDWEGFEDKEGGKALTKKAYEVLGWKTTWGDEEVVRKAEEIMNTERSSQRSGKSTSSRLGAVLVIICSRSSSLNSFPASSTSRSLARVLRLLYLSEAQLHLATLRLPLPPGALNPSDIDLRVDASALEQLEAEKATHEASKKKLKDVQARVDQSTSAATVARGKAEKAEGEVKSLRGELDKLKAEKEELKTQAKDGWAEKSRVESEVEELKAEGKRLRREAQASRPSPLPTPTASSSSVSGDRKDFVIQHLSKQVTNLNRQLKEKNDEILRLMTDMATGDD